MVTALSRHTRQQVVAVGSRTAESAAAFAARFAIPGVRAGQDELFDDPDVDLVYIASPHSEHHRQALAAIAAGKHVLIEKAFCRNANEATDVVAAAAAANVVVMEAMWARFLPQADVLRQLLAGGDLGDVVTVIADHGQYFEPDPAHRLFNPDLAGGALLDLGVYPVSFASMVLGPIGAVDVRGERAFTGVDGQVSLILEAANRPGSHAIVNTTLFAATPTTATVSGTIAGASMSGPFYAPGTLTYRHRGGTVLSVDGGPIRGAGALAYEAAHIAQLIADGATQSPIMPTRESVDIMRILDTARAALGVVLPGE